MSLASDYASGIASAQSVVPNPWSGPGGQLVANVDLHGNCFLSLGGNTQTFTVPAAVILSFANWVTATFT
jgi:hypothetical protein